MLLSTVLKKVNRGYISSIIENIVEDSDSKSFSFTITNTYEEVGYILPKVGGQEQNLISSWYPIDGYKLNIYIKSIQERRTQNRQF